MIQKNPIVILDTSIIIGLLHNNPKAVALFGALSTGQSQPNVSVITKIELEIGVNSQSHRDQVDSLFRSFICRPFTEEMVGYVVHFLRAFGNDRQQKAAMLPDAIIAATAEHLGAHIYTGNLRHFNQFKLLNSILHGYSD